jgi:hypothetical protein
MSKTEIPEDIAALARKVGKQFKSEQDLADFSRLLKKLALRRRWEIMRACKLLRAISRPAK